MLVIRKLRYKDMRIFPYKNDLNRKNDIFIAQRKEKWGLNLVNLPLSKPIFCATVCEAWLDSNRSCKHLR